MQVIRLDRVGRNKYPVYRIVAADKRRAVTGKFISVLGTYNPHTKELIIKKEELSEAINNGAQPSNAVLKLMQKDGIELPKWATIKTRNRKAKNAEETTPEEAASNSAEAPTAGDADSDDQGKEESAEQNETSASADESQA